MDRNKYRINFLGKSIALKSIVEVFIVNWFFSFSSFETLIEKINMTYILNRKIVKVYFISETNLLKLSISKIINKIRKYQVHNQVYSWNFKES